MITGMKPRAAISLTPFTDEEQALLHSRRTQAFDPISAGVQQIPAQPGFIGMDNTPLSAVTYPPLTTIG
ncbi:hypothetical protein J2Y46_000251 [Microbacterium sp. BE35]|uniref:hypothetical protein n=1 Tax=Microbacterium sp. BE35 TaxID=2817773 RepID=UPI00285B31F0|nr:hypothetical protein [Microbacterium sp. BE35]MDR7187435.1 hypothetical protein [Microbacterium sp. BE35]